MTLKKAMNMVEAYQVFETQKPLTTDDREFYVELYKKDLDTLRKELIFNPIPDKSFFLTGQAGNGKSTALNFLPGNKVEEKYDIKYLNGRDVFKLEDIDIIDVILMIGFTVVRGKDTLEKRFLQELNDLWKIKLGKLKKEEMAETASKKEAGAKIDAGAKFPLLGLITFDAGIFAKYKIEKEKRDVIRRIFTLDKTELIQKVNDIIFAYKDETLNEGQKLLIIIDDLEKIRNTAQTDELFVDNHYVFDEIECVKVVTFPIHLASRFAMFRNASKFGVRITQNPFEETKSKKSESGEPSANRDKLKRIIRHRLAKQELVREDALEKAVEMSGGNLRSLMDIMQKAALNAVDLEGGETGNEVIVPRDVDRAAEDLSELPSLSAMIRVGVLKYVMDHHCVPDNEKLMEDFISSVQDNSVFAYFNGNPWYDVNPMIRKSVEVYANQSGKQP